MAEETNEDKYLQLADLSILLNQVAEEQSEKIKSSLLKNKVRVTKIASCNCVSSLKGNLCNLHFKHLQNHLELCLEFR